MRHGHGVVLDPVEQAQFFHVMQDRLTGGETLHPLELLRHFLVHMGVGVEDVDDVQPPALADLEIVEIMARGNLDRAGALFRVGVAIGDDGNAPPDDRQHHVLADQVLISLVIGVHGHTGIAQHGFRAGRADGDVFAVAALDGVLEEPHLAFCLALFDLQVGNRGVQLGVPVDQPLIAVDQALLVQFDKDLNDGLGQTFVHGEAFTRPIAGRTHAAQLTGDGAARFRLPFPDPLDELVATQVGALDAFGLQHALDHHLGRDARMVGAWLPQGLIALHAVIADQDVLQRVVERMPHVQAAGHVRRRNDDGIRLTVGALAPRATGLCGSERAALLPFLVSAGFHLFGMVGLFQFGHGRRSLRFGLNSGFEFWFRYEKPRGTNAPRGNRRNLTPTHSDFQTQAPVFNRNARAS